MINSFVSKFQFLLILCFILPKLMVMEMEKEILCGLSEAHRGQLIKNITEQHLSLAPKNISDYVLHGKSIVLSKKLFMDGCFTCDMPKPFEIFDVFVTAISTAKDPDFDEKLQPSYVSWKNDSNFNESKSGHNFAIVGTLIASNYLPENRTLFLETLKSLGELDYLSLVMMVPTTPVLIVEHNCNLYNYKVTQFIHLDEFYFHQPDNVHIYPTKIIKLCTKVNWEFCFLYTDKANFHRLGHIKLEEVQKLQNYTDFKNADARYDGVNHDGKLVTGESN